ncbi:MAG: glutamine synthetase family protein [Patescibacteria group bacterium]
MPETQIPGDGAVVASAEGGSFDVNGFKHSKIQDKNIALREKRQDPNVSDESSQATAMEILKSDDSIRAVVVCFSDAEGVLHMLDYDKKHFCDSHDALTFDGSSIRGFTTQDQSDLRLRPDFKTLRFLPGKIFGEGKVLMFADVHDKDGTPYGGDMRVVLKKYLANVKKDHGITAMMAPETEGVLLKGVDAEQNFDERTGFETAMETGYFHALPKSSLRDFIDKLACATRDMGFRNEKDHPEVGPGQFELNYGPSDPVLMAEDMLLYKLTARQIAATDGMTASFLPKPIQGENGAGMHTNISLQGSNGENLFFDESDPNRISAACRRAIQSVLDHADEICLGISSSVNAYRRLDPHFEAPNEKKASPNDRGSMVRVPLAGPKSARMEVRSVAPDSNPYLVAALLVRAAVDGVLNKELKEVEFAKKGDGKAPTLPGDIYEAITHFEQSQFVADAMGGERTRDAYVALKREAAETSPRRLGSSIKGTEVRLHHEVANQRLRNAF